MQSRTMRILSYHEYQREVKKFSSNLLFKLFTDKTDHKINEITFEKLHHQKLILHPDSNHMFDIVELSRGGDIIVYVTDCGGEFCQVSDSNVDIRKPTFHVCRLGNKKWNLTRDCVKLSPFRNLANPG